MSPEETMVISASVVTDDAQHATRAAEALARVCAGLVLDGISVNLSLMRVDAEEVEDL